MIHCEKGHENPDGAMYCKDCGQKLIQENKPGLISKLTEEKLRQLLDQIGYRTALDNDGDYYLVMPADKDFKHDVVVYFLLNEQSSRLQIMAIAVDYVFAEMFKANNYIKCNRWNLEYSFGKAILTEKNEIRYSNDFLLDEMVSETYIIENVIKMSVSVAWRFFVQYSNY